MMEIRRKLTQRKLFVILTLLICGFNMNYVLSFIFTSIK